MAASLQNSQPTRLAAVAVLSQLADRDSIETLIDLLETPDELVRRDSLAALTRLTDADYGFEVQQWRRWWLNNRNRPPREWTKAVITSLREEHRSALEEVKSLRAQWPRRSASLYYLSSEPRPAQANHHLPVASCVRCAPCRGGPGQHADPDDGPQIHRSGSRRPAPQTHQRPGPAGPPPDGRRAGRSAQLG